MLVSKAVQNLGGFFDGKRYSDEEKRVDGALAVRNEKFRRKYNGGGGHYPSLPF
jgi:hypothetical protein